MIGGSRKRVKVFDCENRGGDTDDDVERPKKIIPNHRPNLLSKIHPKRSQDLKSCENVRLQSFISKK